MLHLIPRPLHRLGYRLAHGVRKRWWRLRKPQLLGCRVVALDASGRLLLVRHSYGSGAWMLPGGGIGKAEQAISAAARELYEETACRLDRAWELALLEERLHGTVNRVHVIAGGASGIPEADGREIVAAAFFEADALPELMPEAMRRHLAHWLLAAEARLNAD